MGIFDGLPTAVADKPYLKEDLSRVDESWAAARFDSLPHVVHILTSNDREVEARYLKEQSEIIEDAVDEVVHAYHTGFNKAIQNYSQITHREEEIAPFVAEVKRNYIFGGICSSAANASIKALADMKSINLFGVQQICRNSIALEQALAAIPSIDS
ncbi:exocyst complex component SEC8-like isoform X2 [Macadamia integrifolia]|uniref:exocyst complex component SEC8-like isoform X2 n=1 Tax=Macadamia integrifolia TaxID=60698 RepID=UPI001C4F65D2|nr:exocyst complex component SEC8-like isoform X2 [Macadamia integrifolia]